MPSNIVIGTGPVSKLMTNDPNYALAQKLMAKGQETGPTDIFGGLIR